MPQRRRCEPLQPMNDLCDLDPGGWWHVEPVIARRDWVESGALWCGSGGVLGSLGGGFA